MQIYYTDQDPARCAANLPDALTNKILVEVAQILCAVNWKYGIETPYKPTHKNHPFVLWAGRSVHNWNWLWRYARCLEEEWQTSYNKPAQFSVVMAHKSAGIVSSLETPQDLSGQPFTEPPRVFVDDFKKYWYDNCDTSIIKTTKQYQIYLNWKVNNWKREGKNKRLYTWTNRPQPDFIILEK
jgi:hypothetical protein